MLEDEAHSQTHRPRILKQEWLEIPVRENLLRCYPIGRATDPLNAWALTYAAYAELQMKKFDLAIAHARAADGVPHEGLASVHIVAALALEATGQPAEAAEQYRVYLKEDPTGRDAARAREALQRLSSSGSK